MSYGDFFNVSLWMFKVFMEKENALKGEVGKEFHYGYCDTKVLNEYDIHDNFSKVLY